MRGAYVIVRRDGVDGFQRWGVIGGGVLLIRSGVQAGADGAARSLAMASRSSWVQGNAVAMETLMRRTDTVTLAAILRSFRRIVPQVAVWKVV